VLLLEHLHQLRGLRGDRVPAGAVQLAHPEVDAREFPGLTIGARHEPDTQRPGQVLLERALADRGRRASEPVEAAPVHRPPHTVRALDPVEDRVVDVQLRVVIPGVVLEERRDRPVVRVHPAARGAAVVSDPGVAGVLREVVQRRAVAGPDGVLDRLPVRGPSLGFVEAAVLPGGDLLRLERDVQHRDGLLDAERGVQERDVLPGRLAGLDTQRVPPFSVRVRLGVQQPGVQLVLGQVSPSGVSKCGHLVPALRVLKPLLARVEVELVQRVHVLGVNQPGEAELLGAGAVPAARWLAGGDRAGVVVLPTRGDGVGQVLGGVSGGDGQHRHHLLS
jgi:hypothetical protein